MLVILKLLETCKIQNIDDLIYMLSQLEMVKLTKFLQNSTYERHLVPTKSIQHNGS